MTTATSDSAAHARLAKLAAPRRAWAPGGVPEGVKAITFYVMGSQEPTAQGQYWTTLDNWPAFVRTPYYLHGSTDGDNHHGTLSETKPSNAAAEAVAGGEAPHSEYKYDPSDPTPTPNAFASTIGN